MKSNSEQGRRVTSSRVISYLLGICYCVYITTRSSRLSIMSRPSKLGVIKRSFFFLLCVLLSDVLIVNSFYCNTASVSRFHLCTSPNVKAESECLTAHNMVPNGGLDIEVTNFPVPTEKWFPTGEDLSIPAPLNQLVDVNLERRSVVYEVTLGREIGIEIIQGALGPVVGQVIYILTWICPEISLITLRALTQLHFEASIIG